MKTRLILLFALLLFNLTCVFAQQPPEEFFSGMKAMSTDRAQAKKDLFVSIAKAPSFHGAYHFLGAIYSEAGQQDSAIYFLKDAVRLNPANLHKTKEMSYARLIEAYTLKQDFEMAYQTGWEAFNLFPENHGIYLVFKDACIWSYYIKHTGLDKSYLSPVIKEEYVVTSIPQEYLIIRKLMRNGERMQSKGQSFRTIKKENYDVHKLITVEDPAEMDVKFKLNWDMNKEFGGKDFPKDPIIADRAKPIYERLGAVLVGNPKVDLKAEVTKLTN